MPRNQSASNIKLKTCVEYMFLVTTDDLEEVPEVKYKHYNSCTNKMDFVGPIKLEGLAAAENWQLSLKDSAVSPRIPQTLDRCGIVCARCSDFVNIQRFLSERSPI
jgi:hypothetical protein